MIDENNPIDWDPVVRHSPSGNYLGVILTIVVILVILFWVHAAYDHMRWCIREYGWSRTFLWWR